MCLYGQVVGVGKDVGGNSTRAQSALQPDHGSNRAEYVREHFLELLERAAEARGTLDLVKKLSRAEQVGFVAVEQGD